MDRRPHLILLAHLIGDGCHLKRHVLQYTTTDPANVEAVRAAAWEAFGVAARVQRERSWYQVYLSTDRSRTGDRNPIAAWLRRARAVRQAILGEVRSPTPVFWARSAEHRALPPAPLGHGWLAHAFPLRPAEDLLRHEQPAAGHRRRSRSCSGWPWLAVTGADRASLDRLALSPSSILAIAQLAEGDDAGRSPAEKKCSTRHPWRLGRAPRRTFPTSTPDVVLGPHRGDRSRSGRSRRSTPPSRATHNFLANGVSPTTRSSRTPTW